MFESTAPFMFFDYYRVPYKISVPTDGRSEDSFWGHVSNVSEGRATRRLSWPRVCGRAPTDPSSMRWGEYRLGRIPIFGRVLGDEHAAERLQGSSRWKAAEAITDGAGNRVASIWRDRDGNVALPFDPGELIENLWSERYVNPGSATTRLRRISTRIYYEVKPLLPRRLQVALRQRFAKLQTASFPRWPIETAMTELSEWLFAEAVRLAGQPVPWIAPWPNDFQWALVLTHDVETAEGCERITDLRRIERELGLVSSWNFVPLRYSVSDHTLGDLVAEGCEVGVHGLRHDGKDLQSLRTLRSRLPAIRAHAERWGAVGFRAPATQRRWEWMPLLGFEYDTSYPDSDLYEPTPGGCCSYLPFINESTVELPITLPQDHTVFAILQHRDEALWIEKTEHIRSHGGMALVLTHPDYASDHRVIDGYRALLSSVKEDPAMWHALPRDVSRWWRRREASWIERSDDDWVIRGPGESDATLRYATTDAPTFGTAHLSKSHERGTL